MQKLLLLFFLVSATFLSKGSTTIECENKEYAGKTLDFFRYSDPITKEAEMVFSLKFDEAGKSKATFSQNITDFVFCDFGIYHGMLFAGPGETLQLLLPPFRKKSFADEKNPYFSPVAFWIKTKNSAQVTNQISEFTASFNQQINKHFNELYFRQSRAIYDSVVYYLDKDFGDVQSEIFSFHRAMKLKMVEVEAFREKPEQFAKLFSDVKPQFWLSASFIELFDKAFTDQLSFEVKAVKGDELRTAVNKADISYLRKFVKDRYTVSGEIVDLVLLKLFHDAFYSGDFSTSAIKKLVGAGLFTKNSNKTVREASARISKKLTYLQKGSAAPVICLKNLEGQKICTNREKQKFKYLIFADTEMIVCREQLKYLKVIEQRFRKHLEIYVVLRKTEPAAQKRFFAENEIPGIKLIDEKGEFIARYKVKSFPQCFLLNEKHNVQFVSAKAPLDGFEQQFGKFIQNELFMRKRNESR